MEASQPPSRPECRGFMLVRWSPKPKGVSKASAHCQGLTMVSSGHVREAEPAHTLCYWGFFWRTHTLRYKTNQLRRCDPTSPPTFLFLGRVVLNCVCDLSVHWSQPWLQPSPSSVEWAAKQQCKRRQVWVFGACMGGLAQSS